MTVSAMWPFGPNDRKLQDQAQQVGPMLVEALNDFHSTFVKHLFGEDAKVSQKALSGLAMEEVILSLHVLDRLATLCASHIFEPMHHIASSLKE